MIASRSPSSSDATPTTIGAYRVVRRLGAGGIGVVYEAAHASTGARVALKTVRLPETSMLASIRREVYALQRLRHPGERMNRRHLISASLERQSAWPRRIRT